MAEEHRKFIGSSLLILSSDFSGFSSLCILLHKRLVLLIHKGIREVKHNGILETQSILMHLHESETNSQVHGYWERLVV
jgi:hypothetical protein